MHSLTSRLAPIFKSAYFALTIVPLIWASNFIVGKQLVNTLPPLTLTTGRFLVAFLGEPARLLALAIMNYLFLGDVPKAYHFAGGLLVLWGCLFGH